MFSPFNLDSLHNSKEAPKQQGPKSGKLIGYFQSKREANGRNLYEGPNGGIYYIIPTSGKPRYLTENEIKKKLLD